MECSTPLPPPYKQHFEDAPPHTPPHPPARPQELLEFLSPEVVKESAAAAADEGSPSDVTLGSATGRARRNLAAAARAIAAAHHAATTLKAVDEDVLSKNTDSGASDVDAKDKLGLSLHVEDWDAGASPWVQQPSCFR